MHRVVLGRVELILALILSFATPLILILVASFISVTIFEINVTVFFKFCWNTFMIHLDQHFLWINNTRLKMIKFPTIILFITSIFIAFVPFLFPLSMVWKKQHMFWRQCAILDKNTTIPKLHLAPAPFHLLLCLIAMHSRWWGVCNLAFLIQWGIVRRLVPSCSGICLGFVTAYRHEVVLRLWNYINFISHWNQCIIWTSYQSFTVSSFAFNLHQKLERTI